MKWEIVNLEEICEIIAGQSPPSETYNDKGIGYPFFQGKADFGLINPNVRIWCSKPKKIARPNDILLSVRAPVGPTNICNIEAAIGRGLSAIRAGKKLNTFYLLYFLRSYADILSSKGTGSTFTAITQKDIKKIPIPLPPIKTQKRIVALLDRAQALIDKRKEQIALMDQLIQSIFYDMFGDPVLNPMGWDSAYLNSKHGKTLLFNKAKNIVGMANINAEELKDIKLNIPPVNIQNTFADRVKKIESQKQIMTTALKELENNFNSLMQRAFKGEI